MNLTSPESVGLSTDRLNRIGTHFNTAIMPALTDALLDDGFCEADTAAIMGGNYLRVLRQVLPTDDTRT